MHELDQVVVTENLREIAVRSGDIGTIVYVYPSHTAFEVEFVTLRGVTLGVVTLNECAIRPVLEGEIRHARQLSESLR